MYGQADSPVYILIDDDQVTIEDAADLLGHGRHRGRERISRRSHGKKASVASIGPSGEQLSLTSPASATSTAAWPPAPASAP